MNRSLEIVIDDPCEKHIAVMRGISLYAFDIPVELVLRRAGFPRSVAAWRSAAARPGGAIRAALADEGLSVMRPPPWNNS